MVGALIGGRIIRRFEENRAKHLLVSTCVQASFVLAALICVYLLNQLITGPADDASGVFRPTGQRLTLTSPQTSLRRHHLGKPPMRAQVMGTIGKDTRK